MINKYILLFSIFTILFASQTIASEYSYTAPTPTLGEDSLYTITEITKEEYDSLYGNSEVFYDAEVTEDDNIAYHYYKYAQKENTTSSQSITIGNGGQDVTGGWYAKFGTFDGRAINLRSGSLGNVKGDFVNNASEGSGVYSGALYMESTTIKSITGDFVNNHVNGYSGNAYGGAMYVQNNAKITDGIYGNFINNYAEGGKHVLGGAIFIADTYVPKIEGNFIGNHVIAKNPSGWVQGGAIIINNSPFVELIGNYIGNYIESGTKANGGALFLTYGTETNIKGDFINNYIIASDFAFGGAISSSILSEISGNFINNHIKLNSTKNRAFGGAIYAPRNLIFRNDGNTYFFSNNYVEINNKRKYNSIFMETTGDILRSIDFIMKNSGSYVINDSIEGGVISSNQFSGYQNRYNTLFTSEDNSGTVYLADNIINSDITVTGTTLNITKYTHNDDVVTYGGFGSDDNSRSSVSLNNSTLNLHNGYYDKLNIKNYDSSNSILHINIGKDNGNWISDNINISGDITGKTDVIVYALSKDNNVNASIVFVSAPNDTKKAEDAFNVSRVYGSPYMWTAIRNYNDENSGSIWYLVGNQQTNVETVVPNAPAAPEFIKPEQEVIPTPEPEDPVSPNEPTTPEINPIPEEDEKGDSGINYESTPEVIAGIGLHTAGIEQTRTVVRNVAGKVANARSYCPNCGIISDAWDGKQLYNGWVLAQGEYSNIDKPVDMETKIWGVEGGFDMQSDMNNTFGIFASYRNGEYDLSGKGSRYRSDIGSEIEIDSYLAGLYYRYDKNMNWLFATVYGGTQDAEAKTDDGVASFETDGLEFGASAEIGHSFALSDTTTLSPSLGVYYTQINYDNVNDNVGKKYEWDDIKHLEAELGLSLAKNFENGKVYVKPSVIQTLTDDDKVSITGLNEIDTYHDQTLGRVEVGGNYGFNDNWSAYGWANYTFGSSYDATSLGLGVNYSW